MSEPISSIDDILAVLPLVQDAVRTEIGARLVAGEAIGHSANGVIVAGGLRMDLALAEAAEASDAPSSQDFNRILAERLQAVHAELKMAKRYRDKSGSIRHIKRADLGIEAVLRQLDARTGGRHGTTARRTRLSEAG